MANTYVLDSCPQLYYSIPSIARDPNVQSSTEHRILLKTVLTSVHFNKRDISSIRISLKMEPGSSDFHESYPFPISSAFKRNFVKFWADKKKYDGQVLLNKVRKMLLSYLCFLNKTYYGSGNCKCVYGIMKLPRSPHWSESERRERTSSSSPTTSSTSWRSIARTDSWSVGTF